MDVTPEGKEPGPKKFSPGFLLQLEEQRRQRRLEALQKRFEATIQHIDRIEQVNEEHYRRQIQMTDAARTGASITPLPAPPPFSPLQPPISSPPTWRPDPNFSRLFLAPTSKPVIPKSAPKKKPKRKKS